MFRFSDAACEFFGLILQNVVLFRIIVCNVQKFLLKNLQKFNVVVCKVLNFLLKNLVRCLTLLFSTCKLFIENIDEIQHWCLQIFRLRFNIVICKILGYLIKKTGWILCCCCKVFGFYYKTCSGSTLLFPISFWSFN